MKSEPSPDSLYGGVVCLSLLKKTSQTTTKNPPNAKKMQIESMYSHTQSPLLKVHRMLYFRSSLQPVKRQVVFLRGIILWSGVAGNLFTCWWQRLRLAEPKGCKCCESSSERASFDLGWAPSKKRRKITFIISK